MKKNFSFSIPLTNYLLVMALTPLGLLFILHINFQQLFEQTKSSVLAKCQRDRAMAASHFNSTMLKAQGVLGNTARNIEALLRQDLPASQIHQYLQENHALYCDSLNSNFISIYGYVNGAFVDSGSWNPPQDYQPTRRPWFTEGLKGNGKIVLVPPYLDAETGRIVISMVIMLAGDQNVLGIDHYFSGVAESGDELLNGVGESIIVDNQGQLISWIDQNHNGESLPRITANASQDLQRLINMAMQGKRIPETVAVNGRVCSFLFSELMDSWASITIIYHDKLIASVQQALFSHFVIAIALTAVIWAFLFVSFYRLRQARIRAENAEKAKSFFFATVSHDIRTPLNSIIGFSQLLKKQKSNDETTSEYLDYIITSGNALMQLINDILDLSKLDAEKIEYNYEMCDFLKVARETLVLFQSSAEKAHCQLEIQADSDLPLVRIDQHRIRQILFNLIGNAVKFTENGTITIQASFQQTSADYGSLTFSVIDTGIGISKTAISRILAPYVQIGDGTKGTGLGLGICNKLISQMNGIFRIESEEGEGSSFIVTLNKVEFSQQTENGADSLASVPAVPAPSQGPLRFLVVDDIELNLKVLTLMLKNAFTAECVTAKSGYDALEILENQKFDAVLTDMWMPGMSGEELLKAIHNTPATKNLPVYAISADVNLMKNWIEKGFVGVLLKPITFESLTQFREQYFPDL